MKPSKSDTVLRDTIRSEPLKTQSGVVKIPINPFDYFITIDTVGTLKLWYITCSKIYNIYSIHLPQNTMKFYKTIETKSYQYVIKNHLYSQLLYRSSYADLYIRISFLIIVILYINAISLFSLVLLFSFSVFSIYYLFIIYFICFIFL